MFCKRASCRSNKIVVGKKVIIQGFAWIKSRGGRITLSDGVTINSCRWSNPLNTAGSTSIFCGIEGEILIGENSGISSSRLIAMSGITLGRDSLVGAGCLICDSDMHEVPLKSNHAIQSAPIKIGAEVFLGANSTILKGVTIGDGAVVGAGSVVCHDVPSNTIVAGNPARVIKQMTR